MGQGLRILVLAFFLLTSLITPGPGNRFFTRPGERIRTRRGYPSAGGGAPFAVLFGSVLVAAPMAVLLEHERAVLTQHWIGMAALVPAPVVAFALARRLSPPWWKVWPLWIAMRAALLLVVVVGVEMLAVRPGVPMLSQVGRIWGIAALAAAGYLACWRMVDTGYWPLLLIRDGATSLLVAIGIGWWQLAAGGSLALATAGTGQLAVTLLLIGVTAIGLSALGVGGWRLRRWLRNGPPFWPRPPGIPDWPPEPGEVWNAEIIHDDDNHKDRPVLIWEREANYANVLTVTSVDKSGRPEHYVKLPLSEWEGVLAKEAWLSLELTPVPYTDFRSMRGECPARFWQQLGAKKMVRERRPSATPAPGFALRHRLYAAMNRRVGRDARTVPAPPGPRRPAADTSSRSGAGRGRRSSRNRVV